MITLIIFGTALTIYFIFTLWYNNWSGSIKANEIEQYTQLFERSSAVKHTDVTVMRAFLDDDGKAFIMQNFIKLHDGKAIHPTTGDEILPRRL